jgi:hypothetical protein
LLYFPLSFGGTVTDMVSSVAHRLVLTWDTQDPNLYVAERREAETNWLVQPSSNRERH